MALIWRGLTEAAWVRKVYRINKSNFVRVSTGFVLAIRSALCHAQNLPDLVKWDYRKRQKRTVCKGLARPFGVLTEGALLTEVTAENLRTRCSQ